MLVAHYGCVVPRWVVSLRPSMLPSGTRSYGSREPDTQEYRYSPNSRVPYNTVAFTFLWLVADGISEATVHVS